MLADSTVPITSCVNAALVATGHGERPMADLLEFIGPPTRDAFATLTGAPPDSEAVEACVTAYREHYADALWETRAYPGVREAVQRLRDDGWRLGVATSKPRHFALPVLDAIGLREAFDVVAGPGLQAGPASDKTATVGEALERLGAATGMVGDRRFDMVAARHHGLRAIGVLWGFGSREELLEAGAEDLLDAPDQLFAAATRARLATMSRTTGP